MPVQWNQLAPSNTDLARTGHSARFKIIYAEALASIYDMRCPDAETAQLRRARLTNVVAGQACNEIHLHAVVGKRHSHIGLAAAEGGIEAPRLTEPQMIGGGKPQHDLPESDNSAHN